MDGDGRGEGYSVIGMFKAGVMGGNNIGVELITNGALDTTTGWTARNANLSIVTYSGRNNVLAVIDGGIWSMAYQQIATEIGKSYSVSAYTNWGLDASGATGSLQVFSGSGIPAESYGNLADIRASGSGWNLLSGVFVATSASTIIGLMSNSTFTGYFDDVSVKRVA